MIIGTAGHIDHGKTSLVRALTGVNTDRLPEERRRGITIELGFAPLALGEAGIAGIVDVPGHEALVRTMVAGATGVDLALVVVAADAGVMPQTREHLAILTLLGVRGGVIAITKSDLVDEEWLALVEEDVRATVAGTSLGGAAIIRTSVPTGEGLAAVHEALGRAVQGLPRRDADDVFRMPVDRAFTVRGTGTVVTGTVWTGSVGRDDTVQIRPGRASARVRGIEAHGDSVRVAAPATRAALALAGVNHDAVGRGTTLVTGEGWMESRVLRADVSLLGTAGPLRGRTRVRFHLGTAEVNARIVAMSGTIEPGSRAHARIVADEPLLARAGDRFVIRSLSPLATLGGGIVTDPAPPSLRARAWPADASTAPRRLALVLNEGGVRGVLVASLPQRLGASPSLVERSVRHGVDADGRRFRRIGDRLFTEDSIESVASDILARVNDHHAGNPLAPGASLQSLRSRIGTAADLMEAVLGELVARGEVELTGGLIARAGFVPRFTEAQLATRAALRADLAAAGREPPSVSELMARHGGDVRAILRLLEQEGLAVQVEEDRYYDVEALAGVRSSLRDGMQPGREHAPSQLRDLLGVSRKFLIPLLEYCDRTGVTERLEGGRVIHGTRSA
ncbi:MAG: selenocysteine-specific translation elongation factor [Gemmatimonadaceae bacterium]